MRAGAGAVKEGDAAPTAVAAGAAAEDDEEASPFRFRTR